MFNKYIEILFKMQIEVLSISACMRTALIATAVSEKPSTP